MTKNEKKASKALINLGLKPVDGFTRVTLKKSKNVRMRIHSDTTQLRSMFVDLFSFFLLPTRSSS